MFLKSFSRLLAIKFIFCFVLLQASFGQSVAQDTEVRQYLSRIPKEHRSDPNVVSLIRRYQNLKASYSKIGKKHPSYESVQRQLSDAEEEIENVIAKFSPPGQLPQAKSRPFESMPLPEMSGSETGESPSIARRQLDPLDQMQADATKSGVASWGYWGNNPSVYSSWKEHSNRLVPLYILGSDFSAFTGVNSVYRDETRLKSLYGRLPDNTLNANANYMDLTDIYHIQRQAIESGKKKYIFLVVFDGLDFDTLRASAIYKNGQVLYTQGRGVGLNFQDYTTVSHDFAYAVTSPYSRSAEVDVNAQRIVNDSSQFGGYDARLGGGTPWESPRDKDYLFGRSRLSPHAVTDSAASACAMVTGRKLINSTINVDSDGIELETISRWAQREKKFDIGVVTTVPFCHATPAAAYAVNVSRNDYQDLARDMLGLPSVSHRVIPLPGMDVVIGCGAMDESESEESQGLNYIPGNPYISQADLEQIVSTNYILARRTRGIDGKKILSQAVEDSILKKKRLFGLFGVKFGHLPFQTANEDFASFGGSYSLQDQLENPNLSDFTEAAIRRLQTNKNGFWLLVEAGDVDLAAHDNDIDGLIGAVLQGERAVGSIIQWIETNALWDESLLIIASDHGHGFHLADPTAFARASTLGK
jgi:alkaline phosphatase